YDGTAIRGLDGAERLGQQLRVGRRVDLTVWPLTVKVFLVPDLDCICASGCNPTDVGCKLVKVASIQHLTGITFHGEERLEALGRRGKNNPRAAAVGHRKLTLHPLDFRAAHVTHGTAIEILDLAASLKAAAAPCIQHIAISN